MKEKALKIGLFCVIVILAIIGFYQLADYQVRTTTLQSTALQASNTSAGTLVAGEPNPDTYGYNINVGSFSMSEPGPNWCVPVVGSSQIYCVNPGAELQFAVWANTDRTWTLDYLRNLLSIYSPQRKDCILQRT